MAWLGIDLGTQGVRAVVVSADGDVVGSGSRPLIGERDGSRHEQDPAQWWDACADACREAVADAEPEALAVCSTSGTVLLTTPDGDPVTPALMYDDGRGDPPDPQWASGLARLRWLLEHHGTGTLAHQADVVTRRLVGHAVPTDSSHALKSGYDPRTNAWPDDVGEIVPDVVPPGTQLGTVCRAAAERTAIPEGTPVIAGMTDGCAGQIAAGTTEPGDWNSVLGTTLVLKGVATEPLFAGAVYSHRAPDGRWLPGGASSAGGGALERHFAGRDLRRLDAAAAEREPATVVAYPLVGRGERFPFHAPGAEAFVAGDPQDDADLYAALLQGVAFVERLAFETLERLGAPTDGKLTLTGGATKSRYWCQLRADVLQRRVRIPEHADPAHGMAILAARDRPPEVRIREGLEPRADRFGDAYGRFLAELERRGYLS